VPSFMAIGSIDYKHSEKKTVELCKTLFSKIWDKEDWLSNSSEFNPMDYSVWSIMESRACTINHKSVNALKKIIK